MVEKYYLAVVAGELGEESGTIDAPLGKQSSAEAGWKMVPDSTGLAATTQWRRLAVRDGSTLVEFRPLTGRTHQIRAHARAAFGKGIIGDRVYGIPGGPMLLHASGSWCRASARTPSMSLRTADHFAEWRAVAELGTENAA